MKILSVRLHNLNSLKGEHLVRFNSEPLASAGLFAITGPTGAGKTTLLDAITLALYGKVARYGNESNPEHVMTRHCGECSAEVEFEVSSGVYRAAWERHRAGKKPGGKLQAPKRYIYDAAGEPLAQQIREAEQKIENLLGLNYDRFLRSVLLAQGDFARFLKADAKERAGLLESLTGTSIYSRLGKLAHEKANDEKAELDAKEAGLEQIELLDKETKEELTKALKAGEAEDKKLSAEIGQGSQMLTGISQLQTARANEAAAQRENEMLKAAKEDGKEKLLRLTRHRATLPFGKGISEWEHADAAAREASEKSKLALENYRDSKEEHTRASHVLHASLDATISSAKQTEAQEKNAAKQAESETSEARKWLDKNQSDATLTNSLGEVIAAIGDAKSARETATRYWAEWRKISLEAVPDEADALPADTTSLSTPELESLTSQILQAGNGKQAQLKEAGIEAKRQWESRQDHLDKTRLIASLDEHRAELKAGEACPLCGSESHPFADGSPTDAGTSALETEVKAATSNLEKARDEYRLLSDQVKRLESGKTELLEVTAKVETSRSRLTQLLKPLSTEPPAPGEETQLQTALQNRAQAFREKEKQFEAGSKRKDEAESRSKQAAEQAELLLAKKSKLGEAEESIPADIPPIELSDAEEEFQNAAQSEKVAASQQADRNEGAESCAAKLKEISETLNLAIADSEFSTLAELQEANLPAELAEEFESLENTLSQRTAASEALSKQAVKEVSELLKKKVLEGEAAEHFVLKQHELKTSRDTLLKAQTTRSNALSTDEQNRKRKEASSKELKEDRKRLEVSQRLKDLIGSHDGSKFSRHAQSISLDILTRHANRHLVKLSDRYRIRRDLTGELNLEIEDLHQAGAKRPMASLSGGESFLASLALALGLSDLAGRTVRIDSLFIDEGFGSLDPDSLEVAIATLESLQQDHKTVGVISHVDLLKERIGTQIIVEKQPGGVSEIRVVPAVS